LLSISARELAEWRAYYELEPWDEMRGDLRNAMLMALLANINRKKGAQPFRPSDFMPDFERASAGPKEAMSDEQMEAAFRAFAAAANAEHGAPPIVGPDGRPARAA
jgi:hypothetical protein